ncbi:MAG: hypothetical protein LKJ88_02115 [Bacilli bacterium]|jgi:hypothetical protein|nr:hypothetical protein [Bacilli bacterium]
MKKQNLALLCMAPFVIALFGIAAVQQTFALNASDITGIDWAYQDTEAFQISPSKYLLSANPISTSRYALAAGNNLVWSVINQDQTQEPYASISEESGKFYLTALKDGKVTIKVSNAKGTIFKSMNGIIYKDCAIVVNPKILSSQANIDPTIYYGQYDLVNGVKKPAQVSYTVAVYPNSFADQLTLKETSANISYDLASNSFTVNDSGKGYFTFGLSKSTAAKDNKTEFTIVKDGINVFTYDDLLYCTNKSANGEKAVLRTSFGSLKDTYYLDSEGNPLKKDGAYVLKASNIALFGHYDEKKKTFSFADEIYSYQTMFNKEYIEQWNEFAKSNSAYAPIGDTVYAGLRIQKDFYGNGYTLNLHNLTYPYSEKAVTLSDGSTAYVPTLSEANLFRGPKPFYALGDPNKLNLVQAYGEDNSGVILDGDNISFDDVNLKNCDYDGSLSYLDTVGSVMCLNGKGLTIKNSRLTNGKNIIRGFSSEAEIDNSLLAHARNFLVEAGSNKYVKTDSQEVRSFKDINGKDVSSSIEDFFKEKNTNGADGILSSYLAGDYKSASQMEEELLSIQDGLNETDKVKGLFDGSLVIKDSLLSDSGIASIAMESLFNGPYLYNALPSGITDMMGKVSQGTTALIPMVAKNLSGISYPVKVSIEGKTKFYDYKKTSEMDISGLIQENFSLVANSLLNTERKITIDDVFPMKPLLFSKAREQGCVYNGTVDGKQDEYISIPVAFYGGGGNLSEVDFSKLEDTKFSSQEIEADMMKEYLNLPAPTSDNQRIKYMGLKTVTTVTGFSPFRFDCLKGDGYLFGLNPATQDLINNAKGVN